MDPVAFEKGKALLGGMELDPACFSSDDLCHLALEIFQAAGLPEELASDVGRVQRFILAVRESMYDNAYHNFYHVFDVTQTVSVIARRTGTLDRLNAWERFALLAAALCHDLEHPGVSSVFLDRAGGSVAGAFKDTVLEKHHVLRAFEVMVGQDIGLLKGLSSESYWDFRNAVAGCILATDIAKHSSYCAQVRELLQDGAARPVAIQLEMELLIKCADISNVLKPFPIARRWALRVTDEVFHQGDVERTLGMPVTPTCDRRTQSRVDIQRGFIKAVGPFFDSIATLYPGLRPDVDRMHRTSKKWESYSDAKLEESRLQDFDQLHPMTQKREQDSFPDLFCAPPGGHEQNQRAQRALLTPGLGIMVSRARWYQQNPVLENSVPENSVQEDTVQEDSVQEDSVAEGPVAESSAQQNSVQEDTVHEGTVQQNAVPENSVQESLVQEDSVQDDSVQENAVQGNWVPEDSVPENLVQEDCREVGSEGPRRTRSEV